MSKAVPAQSFKENFGVLQRHAETLRNQREPNIDDLLTIVTESVAAYKGPVCSASMRWNRALGQALGQGRARPPAAAGGCRPDRPLPAIGSGARLGFGGVFCSPVPMAAGGSDPTTGLVCSGRASVSAAS